MKSRRNTQIFFLRHRVPEAIQAKRQQFKIRMLAHHILTAAAETKRLHSILAHWSMRIQTTFSLASMDWIWKLHADTIRKVPVWEPQMLK